MQFGAQQQHIYIKFDILLTKNVIHLIISSILRQYDGFKKAKQLIHGRM